MGRKSSKSRRQGVIWGADPVTGSPTGRDVHAWDGQSRTSKRNRARALIDERREALNSYIQLTAEARDAAIQQTRLEHSEREEDAEALNEDLLEQLERLAAMKRGGAKQREIKHTSTSIDDDDWEVIHTVLRIAREASS